MIKFEISLFLKVVIRDVKFQTKLILLNLELSNSTYGLKTKEGSN